MDVIPADSIIRYVAGGRVDLMSKWVRSETEHWRNGKSQEAREGHQAKSRSISTWPSTTIACYLKHECSPFGAYNTAH